MHPGQSARTPRRSVVSRALLTLVSACVAGLALGGFAVHEYETNVRPSYGALFRGLELTPRQASVTDSLMAHYSCAIDSVNNTIVPAVNTLRASARREVEAVLTPAQTKKLRANFAELQQRRSKRHDGHGCVRREGAAESR